MAITDRNPAAEGISARGGDRRTRVVGVRCRLYLDVVDGREALEVASKVLGRQVLDPGLAIGFAIDEAFEPDPEDLARD